MLQKVNIEAQRVRHWKMKRERDSKTMAADAIHFPITLLGYGIFSLDKNHVQNNKRTFFVNLVPSF